MSFNPGSFGDQRQVSGRIAAKYSNQAEAEVSEWIKALLQHQMPVGPQAVEKELKNGVLLVKICQKLAEGTPELPELCRNIRLVIKDSSAPFQQMENIDLFLYFAECYGVNKTSLFQTVDLYEGRNMPSVLTCILILGSEAQRHGFRGPVCGPKPSDKRKVPFTLEQLKQSETYIPTCSGTNKYASQQGMSAFGAVRHGGDTGSESVKESNGILSLQMGTNQFASQQGMTSMGAFRLTYDHHIPIIDKHSEAILTLQTGTNQFASQKGMTAGSSIGGFRDINGKGELATAASEEIIPLQSGTNKFASQQGMTAGSSIGGRRDIRSDCADPNREGASLIPLASGTNRFASQKGMLAGGSVGGLRDLAGGIGHGPSQEPAAQEGHNLIPLACGTNKFASQKGMAMGNFRNIYDGRGRRRRYRLGGQHCQVIKIMPSDVDNVGPCQQNSEGIITLQAGYNQGATQKGMVFGGMRHGADLRIPPIWSDF